MWFIPRRPNLGTHVELAVTSRRHHDVRFIRLVGPLDAGQPTERLGPLGFVWTWTVVPAVEAFHQWTFYADGLRPCITSGFNTFAPLGATPTPTATPIPTNTPGTATATATPTPIPLPTVSSVVPDNNLSCGQVVTINGSNFGSPPSSFATQAWVTSTNSGTGTTRTTPLSQVGTGSDRQIRVTMPAVNSGAIVSTTNNTVFVSNNGGDSNLVPVTFAAGASC
jgi:hypothetical protein